MSRGRSGWASDAEFERRASEARAQLEAQRERRRAIAKRVDRAWREADEDEKRARVSARVTSSEVGIDIGEGSGAGVDVIEVIRKLQERDAERARRVQQRQARALADGSKLVEQDGTRLVRMRTEAQVRLPGGL